VLLTNLQEFGSTTSAAIYKDRWQIELFFQALKQNLKVKTFVGNPFGTPPIFPASLQLTFGLA
jgi:IS4 transposase